MKCLKNLIQNVLAFLDEDLHLYIERVWPPCKVVFFGLATNALNVRNNNNNNYISTKYSSF